MNTKKSLGQQIEDIQKSKMSFNRKFKAIVELGVTPYEAQILARTSIKPAKKFYYTFGVEMETYNCNPNAFMRAAQQNGFACIDHTSEYRGCHTDIAEFKLVPDGSLTGFNSAECVTPALKGDEEGFGSLKACCNALAQVGAKVNSSCGLHVHIGARDLTDKEFCNVFVNYMRLELAIDSFLAPSRRGSSSRWCYSLRNHEQAVLNAYTKSGMRQALNYDRYHRVNAEAYNRHQTIEFRQHQGSVNYTKISAWIKFLAKLVEYSKTHRLAANIDRIEDIPFLSDTEKNYFIGRRSEFEARQGL